MYFQEEQACKEEVRAENPSIKRLFLLFTSAGAFEPESVHRKPTVEGQTAAAEGLLGRFHAAAGLLI